MYSELTKKEYFYSHNADVVREGLIAYKISVHAADIARHRPVAGDRDDELRRARYACDLNKHVMLSLDSEWAKQYHEETLLADIYKQAEFCSMFCSKHCPMETKITDKDLEVLENVLEVIGGAELSGLKMDRPN